MANSNTNLKCKYYKVPNLSTPILETSQISHFQDRYILGKKLGSGQFGLISACSDLLSGEILAVKSISKSRLLSSTDLHNIKLEIEIMMHLSSHPNIVNLKSVYEEQDYIHLVMELCAGGELFHQIEKKGRFLEQDAAFIFKDLMEVVLYCHKSGIVHRDLKPENILLVTNSSSSPIKVADFGLATYVKPGQKLSGMVGSPFYIAPEVLVGEYNEGADVWSAGVILYVLLSGMPPFWGKTKSRIFSAVRSAELIFPCDPWNKVSDSAKELVAGMLCRDKIQRFTAKQVLEHSWIKDHTNKLQCVDPHKHLTIFGRENSISSSSTTIMASSMDISFSFNSPASIENQPNPSSPTFTCLTPFSPLHENTPNTDFSFSSSSLINNFSFFTPPPIAQECIFDFTSNEIIAKSIQIGSINRKLLESVQRKEEEDDKGVASASRAISRHGKRNHTIGMGEFEQLDLVVSDSVIRWASCVHLTEAMSLRSSLVC